MRRRSEVVLEEIREAIDVVESALDGVSEARFRSDLFKQRGVERSVEIISEAVRHLPDDLLTQRSDISWSDVRSIGNRVRHEYWRVDPEIMWSVARHDLPALRAAVEGLLASLRS
jgi:uncharacterized protein with HEPN domain